jgi:hypothetical protein
MHARRFAYGLAAASLAGAASADITVPLADFVATGFQFFDVEGANPGEFIFGNLTGASVNAVLTASTNFTYADDLCIYVDVLPLSNGGLLQCGGFSNLSASQRYFWPNGGSSAPGTVVSGTVNFASSIFIDQALLDAPRVWIGNGYGASGTSGTWTGTVTLHGLDYHLPGCPADTDGDGQVLAEDLAAVLGAWGSTGPKAGSADVNEDGVVNADDLAEVLAAWGPCP